MSSELWTEGESYSSMCSKPTPHLDAFLHVQTKDSPSEKRLSIPDPFDGLEQLAASRGLSLDHKHVSFSPPGAINSHIAQRNHSHFFFLIVQLLNSCNDGSLIFFSFKFLSVVLYKFCFIYKLVATTCISGLFMDIACSWLLLSEEDGYCIDRRYSRTNEYSTPAPLTKGAQGGDYIAQAAGKGNERGATTNQTQNASVERHGKVYIYI